MNNEYAESCRVISEYWTLMAEGKPARPLEHKFINGGALWCSAASEHIINPRAFYYRWKPETVRHLGGEYPKPCKTIEEVRNAPDPHYASVCSMGALAIPICNGIDGLIKLGVAHPTKEAALQHARVMLGLGGSDE